MKPVERQNSKLRITNAGEQCSYDELAGIDPNLIPEELKRSCECQMYCQDIAYRVIAPVGATLAIMGSMSSVIKSYEVTEQGVPALSSNIGQ